jgi:diadenosine tetraphosphate (Ap4A) HIT family hydrolase
MTRIDKRLLADCHQLEESKSIAVLLHRNAQLPWFILVPLSQKGIYRELFELPKQQRTDLQKLSDLLSSYLIESFESEKINVAALGNVVEQLHLHVIGRRRDDNCWPDPVWGNLNHTASYSQDALSKIESDISSRIAQCL